MKENTKLKAASSADHIGHALYAFGGLGIEILLIMLETNLYGQTSGAWSAAEHIFV